MCSLIKNLHSSFPFLLKSLKPLAKKSGKTVFFDFLDRNFFFQKIIFIATSCTYYLNKCGSTSLSDQNSGLQSRARTDTQTPHGQTKKNKKTEGPKILSNYIFYFKTVIIGGPAGRCAVFVSLGCVALIRS